MKRIRIRDRLLLGLALSTDFLIPATLRAMRGLPPQNLSLWEDPQYKRENLYNLVSRLLKTQEIEKIIKDGQPYLRLSNQGKIKLQRDFPLLKMQVKPWDNYWRLVVFDIKETNHYLRDILREKLKSLGFGKLQQSVYISPYDFEEDLVEFIDSHHLSEKVFVLVAKHRLMGDARILANKVWHLDELEIDYYQLLRKVEKIKSIKSSQERKTKAIQSLRVNYFDLLLKDPLLPKELLPNNWVGFQIRQEISIISI